MFCQTCGNAIVESLNFCNRCGARTSDAIEKKERPIVIHQSKPTGIVITLAIVTGLIVLTGIGMLFPLLIVLLRAHLDVGAVAAITFLFLGTLFGISWLLIKQISRTLEIYHQGIAPQIEMTNQQPTSQPAQLFDRITGQIEAPREPFISVTEHTTRILDPVQQERK